MNTQNNEKIRCIVFFEEIDFIWFFFVIYYLLKGRPIYYIRINRILEKSSMISKLVENRKIMKFNTADTGTNHLYALNSIVLEDIEKIFNENLGNNKTLLFFERLVENKSIINSYKKGVATFLFEFYRMVMYIDILKNDLGIEKECICFYPGRTFLNLCGIPYVDKYIKKEFPAIFSLSGRLVYKVLYYLSKAKWILIYFAFPFWVFFSVGIPSFRKTVKLKYNIGIRAGSNDWSLSNKYRCFDFLFDNKNISSENTIFCSEEKISSEYKKNILGKKYRLVEVRKILKNANLDYINTIFIKKFFPVYIKCLVHSIFENVSILILTAKLFRTYLIWSAFEMKYELKNYITYSEYIQEDILRNILLEKNGVRTWIYEHSISAIDSYESPGNNFLLMLETFCYYDTCIVWGKRMESFIKRHPHKIKNFERLGCFWSEHVRIILEGKYETDVLRAAKKKFLQNERIIPEKIIGVFDTTAGGDSIIAEADMIDFINAMFELLDENPTFGIIFKNKFPLRLLSITNPSLLESYEKIRDHPRCYLADELNSDPSETIASSDLVISISFTSPTVEALGARKKAIYYAPNNKFRGSYYDRIPRIVAHDCEDLKRMTNYWLNEMTETEFCYIIDKYIVGELDQYADGKAITRFRAELTKEQ